ncbi:hypothetical protein MA20_34025 [Bradyrhizobium japonicum]|jgi:hypothetical protein|uniref:Uncharacterized protein n=2 Tax=Nitrobacteraceae TaxID=41294 RepID=A0A0A3XM59_BRAJP|nr:hypothetical protein [Bradyrhizobium japonicum]KGT75472.1 hypothetical protein MA20_34025 [Bradyrhizobium japonicum]MCS3894284.1 hypothetical protein [Bradyrhizobium japonicum USDA 38]MCS3946798.1 hypothetical protein [Bradyrhizobium japonicum]MCW2220427.1 hypothetical protein [Bradyrhizobium japonicum]MCW2345041.1 hypothetical protein [Bradyrhizobium japonicum]
MLLASLLGASGRADALDLNGAWVSDADNCPKVFARNGSQLGFTEMSDAYGGGFIINGDQIAGKFARCRIKARKDNGPYVNLIAACATDIMLSSVQFNLKELDSNSLVRLFPGMEDMEIRYHRCLAK